MNPRLSNIANADFDALSRLHAEGFDPPWSAAALCGLLQGTNCFACVAGPDVAPDGLIICRVAADEAEILTLVVSRARRWRGLGRSLVVAAATHAAQRGARAMFLEVDDSNTAARGLYEMLGFVVVGKRPAYYGSAQGAAGDAHILKSALPLAVDGK
jgi:ribosomal-protein-alanine N-acetyltransferase